MKENLYKKFIRESKNNKRILKNELISTGLSLLLAIIIVLFIFLSKKLDSKLTDYLLLVGIITVVGFTSLGIYLNSLQSRSFVNTNGGKDAILDFDAELVKKLVSKGEYSDEDIIKQIKQTNKDEDNKNFAALMILLLVLLVSLFTKTDNYNIVSMIIDFVWIFSTLTLISTNKLLGNRKDRFNTREAYFRFILTSRVIKVDVICDTNTLLDEKYSLLVEGKIISRDDVEYDKNKLTEEKKTRIEIW